MCYPGHVRIVGLRELRQNASELVRRAGEGEEITITVAGRLEPGLFPRLLEPGGGGPTCPNCSPGPQIPRGMPTVS